MTTSEKLGEIAASKKNYPEKAAYSPEGLVWLCHGASFTLDRKQ